MGLGKFQNFDLSDDNHNRRLALALSQAMC